MRAHLHDSVSVGVIDLDPYRGSEPVVFDQVVPNEAIEGVRILGYVVVTTPGEGIRSADGFPPADVATRSLRGFRLTPGRGPIQVVVGFELTHEGVHHVEGLRAGLPRSRVGM